MEMEETMCKIFVIRKSEWQKMYFCFRKQVKTDSLLMIR
jgi:hypothetical protein